MSKRIRKYNKYSGTDNKVHADDQTYLAYTTWLGIKLHMTTEKYDVIKYLGKSTNTSRESMNSYFQKKELKFGNSWCPERTILHRIGRSYDKERVHTLGVYDIWSYFIFQFTRDRIYLYDMDEDGFKEWLDIVDMYSWENHFKKDLNIILQNLKKDDGYEDFQTLFTTDGITHPKIFKLCVGGHVSLETIIMMNCCLGFIKDINNSINDISDMWDDFYLKCKKYTPLLEWIMERNKEYAIENPISNVHPSEYYETLDIVNHAKEIMREVFYPVYG